MGEELVCAGAHPHASASMGRKSGKSFSFMFPFPSAFFPFPCSLIRGLRAAKIALTDPRHESTQARAGLLNRMFRTGGKEFVVLLLAGFGFLDPALGK